MPCRGLCRLPEARCGKALVVPAGILGAKRHLRATHRRPEDVAVLPVGPEFEVAADAPGEQHAAGAQRRSIRGHRVGAGNQFDLQKRRPRIEVRLQDAGDIGVPRKGCQRLRLVCGLHGSSNGNRWAKHLSGMEPRGVHRDEPGALLSAGDLLEGVDPDEGEERRRGTHCPKDHEGEAWNDASDIRVDDLDHIIAPFVVSTVLMEPCGGSLGAVVMKHPAGVFLQGEG
mmetsp:Transcript_36233/g.104203  ORF Transcript_36233/g.104203 Transcript_36233/m.104203 type:complete len:228 (+) Transcript_36233:947-1630(+)